MPTMLHQHGESFLRFPFPSDRNVRELDSDFLRLGVAAATLRAHFSRDAPARR